MPSEISPGRIQRVVMRYPRLTRLLMRFLEWYEERRKKKLECPECGDLRANLVPHGKTCLNKNCGRYLIAY